MLLAQEVVLVGVLTVEGLPTGFAGSLEVGLVGLGGRGGAGLEDLLGEDIGGDGGQRCYSALEVVPAA